MKKLALVLALSSLAISASAAEQFWSNAGVTLRMDHLCVHDVTVHADAKDSRITVVARADKGNEIARLRVDSGDVSMPDNVCGGAGGNVVLSASGQSIVIVNGITYVNGKRQGSSDDGGAPTLSLDIAVPPLTGVILDAVGDAPYRLRGEYGDTDTSVSGGAKIDMDAVRALNATVSGSGEIRIAAIDGPAVLHVSGAGGISIKGGRIAKLKATVSGSGGVDVGAAVDDAHLALAGSGNIHLTEAPKQLSKSISGSGDVTIGK